MKKHIDLAIPKPCSQEWNTFTYSSIGGYCSSCQKTVIDFTKMSDEQILDFFNANPSNTCGRFRNDQLRTYHHNSVVKVPTGLPLLKAGVASLLVLLMSKPAPAQTLAATTPTEVSPHRPSNETKRTSYPTNHVVKGVVMDESDEPLPGVSVVLKGTTIGTVTDLHGKFEFPQKLKEGDVLVFSFIGFTTKEYYVPSNPESAIEIRFTLDMCVLMGEVAVDGVYEEPPSGFSKLVTKVKRLF